MSAKNRRDSVGSYDYLTLEGVITAVRVLKTKAGKLMAFVKVNCQDGPAELVFFPAVYLANSEAFLIGSRIKVKALPDCDEKGKVTYLVDAVVV